MPRGRLTKKIHRQLTLSTITPPTSGPRIAAIPHIDENNPKYFPRSRGGTMSPTVAKVRPQIPPPPIPWSARAAMSWGMDWAAPQSNEAKRNRAMVKRSNRLRPYKSLSLPRSKVAMVDVTAYEVDTHAYNPKALNCPAMVGMAVPTIVLSRAERSSATMSEPITRRLDASGRPGWLTRRSREFVARTVVSAAFIRPPLELRLGPSGPVARR